MKHKYINLVLSGSGTLYPVQAGAVIRLIELGYIPVAGAASSGGAIVLGYVASGRPLNEQSALEMLISTLPEKNNLINLSLIDFVFKQYLCDGNKVEEAFKQVFVPTFNDTSIPIHIAVSNLSKGKYEFLSSETHPNVSLARAVRASMSLPFIFKPVKIGKNYYEDPMYSVNFPIEVFKDSNLPTIGFRFSVSAPTGLDKDLKISDGFLSRTNILSRHTGLLKARISLANQSNTYMQSRILKNGQIIELQSKYSGLNFKMTEEDVVGMFNEGKAMVNRLSLQGLL